MRDSLALPRMNLSQSVAITAVETVDEGQKENTNSAVFGCPGFEFLP